MKLTAMAVNMATTQAAGSWAMPKPTGTRKRPMATQKAGKVSSAGSTANLMIAAKSDATGGAERERDGAAVGQIASSAKATAPRLRRTRSPRRRSAKRSRPRKARPHRSRRTRAPH